MSRESEEPKIKRNKKRVEDESDYHNLQHLSASRNIDRRPPPSATTSISCMHTTALLLWTTARGHIILPLSYMCMNTTVDLSLSTVVEKLHSKAPCDLRHAFSRLSSSSYSQPPLAFFPSWFYDFFLFVFVLGFEIKVFCYYSYAWKRRGCCFFSFLHERNMKERKWKRERVLVFFSIFVFMFYYLVFYFI